MEAFLLNQRYRQILYNQLHIMKIHPINDKLAAGLSIACALHCLLVPSFLIVTSGALALSINNELIHWAILFLAIPISVYALITGVSNHNDYGVFLVGLAGLGLSLIHI